ncbi:hypothetical protein [Pseudomonas frederiksbergensis]|uniref:hypothetical protein n=1 Tax=Pseudomonas frederiksbergensis TaxID=104087 RepID=UPI003D2052DC
MQTKMDAGAFYTSQWLTFESDYWSTKQRRGRINHSTLQTEMGSEIDLPACTTN